MMEVEEESVWLVVKHEAVRGSDIPADRDDEAQFEREGDPVW